MNNRLIITLPIFSYDKMFVGKMTTPVLGESLAISILYDRYVGKVF